MYTLIFRAVLPETPVSQFNSLCTINKSGRAHREGWGTTRALRELREQPRSRGTERSFPLNVESGSELHAASLTNLQSPATPPGARSNRNRRAPWCAYKGPLYPRLIQQVEQGCFTHPLGCTQGAPLPGESAEPTKCCGTCQQDYTVQKVQR